LGEIQGAGDIRSMTLRGTEHIGGGAVGNQSTWGCC
jgi:hypothetical protein